ncbi:MAG: hypothetical protein CVU07_00885, partial [Bacteroidetes bacterium HGW-Bacteroidetes-23]
HGNAKKKEVSPDGSPDQNVFDIMQGVSINLFVKTGKKKKDDLGEVFHHNLYGKRDFKYDKLKLNFKEIKWTKLECIKPNYFYYDKDLTQNETYKTFIKLDKLFNEYVSGIQTKRDDLTIKFCKEDAEKTKSILLSNESIETLRKKLNLPADGRDWTISGAIEDLKNNRPELLKYQHRPFDERYTFYTGKSKGFLAYPRYGVLKHFISSHNIGILLPRQAITEKFGFFLCDKICDINYTGNAGQFGAGLVFPLYLYPDTNGQQSAFESAERVPNLNMEIVTKMATDMGLFFAPEKADYSKQTEESNQLTPIDILDYIYAVLHSPKYREKYKEFLKIDFPRVPYPKDQKTFFDLVDLGSQLREIHLLESPLVTNYITQYPEDGDNVVTKPRFENSPPLEGCPKGGVVENTNPEPDTYIKSKPIYFNTKTDLPYNPKLKPLIKELRYANNLSEVLFWKQVHKGHFYKIDFDRQRIIGNYIVDFYVKKLGLVIEIDGSSHDNKEEYDAERQAYLESLGLKVCRIKVGDVLNRMSLAMNQVEDFIIEHYSDVVNEVSRPMETNPTEEPPRPMETTPTEEPPRPMGTPPKEGNVGRVYINETQFFANVPEVAWNFYIGGYQPAQKWLKDRKGRELSYEDILHYQKIIVALKETDGIMGRIDLIEF